MTMSVFAAAGTPGSLAGDSRYRPGTCNIGPAEIASRRRGGHVGLLVTIVLFAVLVALGVPPLVRLAVALPAALAAAGYLQAWLRFCAGFGSRGVFNFGPLGATERVEDVDALSRDRARATRIGLASLAVGIAAGVVAALLPL